MPMYAMGGRSNRRGKHFREAYDLPASPHAARLRLRAGLADYLAFARNAYLRVPKPVRSLFWGLLSWAFGELLSLLARAFVPGF